MPANIMIHLFGKPAWELGEGQPVSPQQLRDLGDILQARLHEAAEVTEKLVAKGWLAQVVLYDVMVQPPREMSAEEVEDLLVELGLDSLGLEVEEYGEE